ncbi:hypothetical protein RsTz2092_09400 [Deferribacterales bacterium RsTz2092]|nr:hypothetical protein AGMMS49941_07100 [Deferribacterales bacterium]
MFSWSFDVVSLADASNSSEELTDGMFPAMDIIETATYVSIRLDMPGIHRGDVYLSNNGNKLIIEGVKRPYYPECVGERSFLLAERQYKPFRRVFSFDEPIDAKNVSTRLMDGVLNIRWEK